MFPDFETHRDIKPCYPERSGQIANLVHAGKIVAVNTVSLKTSRTELCDKETFAAPNVKHSAGQPENLNQIRR